MSSSLSLNNKTKIFEKDGSFLTSLKEFFQVIWRNKMARVGF